MAYKLTVSLGVWRSQSPSHCIKRFVTASYRFGSVVFLTLTAVDVC